MAEAFHSVAFPSLLPPMPPYVRLLLCKLQHRSPFFFSTLVASSSPSPHCRSHLFLLLSDGSSSSFSTDCADATLRVCRRHSISLSLFLSLSRVLSISLFRRSPFAGASTKREVYKFARRNCHEKYGILSASKATLVAAWETPAKGAGETKCLAGLQRRRFRRTSLARSCEEMRDRLSS